LRSRDAVNQVSYEYIACQQARQGVMILSEFAGAAQSLNGSIVVNPWDSQQVADAIHEAVTMPAEVRAENHRKLFKYVNKYSAAFWGTSFVREMLKIAPGSDGLMLGTKAGQGVLLPGSAGGSRLPASSAPVEIDRIEIAA
jgi:trehalose 6-phosphate synthase